MTGLFERQKQQLRVTTASKKTQPPRKQKLPTDHVTRAVVVVSHNALLEAARCWQTASFPQLFVSFAAVSALCRFVFFCAGSQLGVIRSICTRGGLSFLLD